MNPAGHRIRLTVHVIDASGHPQGAVFLAQAGRGAHARVDFVDPDAVVESVAQVLQLKADTSGCED